MKSFFDTFYFIVDSEIPKNTHRDIFHIFTSEDIDHVIIFRQKICFQYGDVWPRAANPFLSLFKEKHVFVEKMKILQENTEMMPRYSLSLDNMM